MYASLFGDSLEKWRDLANKSDPNDTSIMQGFKEHILEPSIETFLKSSEGMRPEAQRWMLSRADTMREELTKTMIADMGTRAGKAVHKNLGDMERIWSNTVALNPEKLPLAVDTIKADIAEQVRHSAYLKPADAARLELELVPAMTKSVARAAAFGMARSNPEGLATAIAQGTFEGYLDAEDQARATNLARESLNHKRTNAEYEYHQQQRVLKDKAEDAANTYITDILNGKKLGDYANDPRLLKFHELKENIQRFQHSYTTQLREKKDTTPHPDTVYSLRSQLFITARDDPNNLYRVLERARSEFVAGNLNPSESDQFEHRFSAIDKPMERNYLTQLQTAERSIKGSILGRAMATTDPAWGANTMNMIDHDAHMKLDAARSKSEDLTPLLDPSNQRYLFSRAVIQSYLTTPEAEVAAEANKVRAKEAPQGPTSSGKIGGPPAVAIREFKTMAEAEKAKLERGTRIRVGGVVGTWQ